MKVLHISPYTKDDFYSAGVVADEVMDSHINRIAKMLHQKGVETTILYFSRFESRTRTLAHKDGYDVIVAKSIRVPWHVHFSFDIFEWLEVPEQQRGAALAALTEITLMAPDKIDELENRMPGASVSTYAVVL